MTVGGRLRRLEHALQVSEEARRRLAEERSRETLRLVMSDVTLHRLASRIDDRLEPYDGRTIPVADPAWRRARFERLAKSDAAFAELVRQFDARVSVVRALRQSEAVNAGAGAGEVRPGRRVSRDLCQPPPHRRRGRRGPNSATTP